jgi:hypothetical protein
MPLVAGDRVILSTYAGTKFLGQYAAMLGGGGMPLVGNVDAVASPSVRVTWENGVTTQYLDDGAQLVKLTTTSAAVALLFHTRVRLAFGTFPSTPGNPNGQSVSEGLVIGCFTIDPAGPTSDFIVVKMSAGDIATFSSVLVS